jgi:transposase-like protein
MKRTKPYTVKSLADEIGVHVNSIWNWRRTGKLPKNPLIRAAYLRLTAGKGKRKAVPK